LKPYVIAEIGSNCFLDDDEQINFDNAVQSIHGASIYGASAVKFQLFTSKELWGVDDTVRDTKKFNLPREWLPKLHEYCEKYKIDFMCTGFSVDGYEAIDPYVKMHKLASPEVWDNNICNYLFSKDQPKPVLVSLGCVPTFSLDRVLNMVRKHDILLECVSKYPAETRDYDLHCVRYLSSKYDYRWGVSDHTLEDTLAIEAREFGALYFEKHVDFLADCYNESHPETPDSCVSINRHQFGGYVLGIQSTDIFNYDKIKVEAKEKYGRRRFNNEWYRPL